MKFQKFWEVKLLIKRINDVATSKSETWKKNRFFSRSHELHFKKISEKMKNLEKWKIQEKSRKFEKLDIIITVFVTLVNNIIL